jgi:exopolysaccharide biosynthesis polyprenyl glycosylphosphotransferase
MAIDSGVPAVSVGPELTSGPAADGFASRRNLTLVPGAPPRNDPSRIGRITAPQVLVVSDLICMTLPATWNVTHVRAIATVALVSVTLFWSADLYRPRLQPLFLDEFPALLGRMLAATGIVAALSALRHATPDVSTFLAGAAAAIALTLAARAVIMFGIRLARRRRIVVHRSMIVGSGPIADRLADTLSTVPDYGLSVVGYLADNPSPGSPIDEASYLGPIRKLRSSIYSHGVEVVIICDQGFAEGELHSIVRQALWNDCDIFLVPRLHDVVKQAWVSEMIGTVPVARIGSDGRCGVPWRCKRAFDIAASSLALVLLSPLLALCALAVRIDGGPGIIFRQVRVGRDGKPFEILKFRSLRPVDTTESQTKWSISNDDRMTPIGRIMRRTSLDELPQLWTILRGEMTIVGPRPERPHFVKKFSGEEPSYLYRHRVPAGLTGLAQVNGMRGDTSIAERSRFDNYYIENWSLWLDVKIILRTFSEILSGQGG